ncbi:hypothetical protein Sango_1725800 [Sesamum angolense]|uniref:Uncharacterized protein n=1 Tax=Sesamum angolense TaxID=2727404 RepID=A0AAE1WLY0_9LAMI|nr:hypothetical protein Sango_1725800 [Sesamum angolense]
MAACTWTGTPHLRFSSRHADSISSQCLVRFPQSVVKNRSSGRRVRIYCSSDGGANPNSQPEPTGIQLYRDIERSQSEPFYFDSFASFFLLWHLIVDGVNCTECSLGAVDCVAKVEKCRELRNIESRSTYGDCEAKSRWLGGSGDWSEIEGAWVLRPRNSNLTSIVHFVGGIFVGAAPQLTYRLFLERLADKGILVIATPYASGFDHFLIADEVQFKFERCLRYLQETVEGIPTFGIGHSLGSVIHLLIGSRYAVQRSGNILMAFNNKAEMTRKQFENLSPSILKQVLPLVEQLPPLYMDLAKGREDFSPKPEETRRLIRSYYGIPRNLLIKFKDDTIDETSTLAQVLSSDSAISSMLDMSIRLLPGDHGLPLQQVLPDVPPAMADAVNRGGELLATLTAGTPWEAVAKEVGSTFGADSSIFRAYNPKELDLLVDVITTWIASNSGPRLLRP